MAEYIEREAAIRALLNDAPEQVIDWYRPYGQTDEPIPFETLVSDLRDMKAADVAPVRHGRWILDEKRYVIYCSECGEVSGYSLNLRDVREENHYCPNCGCKMDLEG